MKLSALRGPVLSYTNKAGSPACDQFNYEKDAIIILNENKIIEFGDAKKLKNKLTNNMPVQIHKNCKIIKSIDYS